MLKKNVGFSAGLLAFAALVFHVSSNPQSQGEGSKTPVSVESPSKAEKKSKSGSDSNSTKERSECPQSSEGPWTATRSFFGRAQSDGDPCDAGFKKADLPKLFGFRSESGSAATAQAFFLIATVPDPFHTRLSALTDGTLEGIRAAAKEAGWVLATQWLPWSDPLDPEVSRVKERQAERMAIRHEESEPGVLVFRRELDSKKPEFGDGTILVVFLVGETPTLGVNGVQMKNALEYRRALLTVREGINSRIGVLAPHFSGSFYSLRQWIAEDSKRLPKSEYNVQGGTATSTRNADALRSLPGVTFESSALNTADQQLALDQTVERLGLKPEEVAQLSDDSEYGAALEGGAKYRTYHFPRDISHVRNAYKDISQPGKAVTIPGVEFSLKDAASGEDALPMFSPAQTPNAQNAVLNQIMDDLRNEGIRLVQLSSTNVLDAIFLAGELRRQCPDIRLVLPFPHLLFVQAEEKAALIGSLFISNYPMFAVAEAGNRRQGWVIANSQVMAVYNSTLILLGKRELIRDYQWNKTVQPPNWLLMLDRKGFQPVSVSSSAGSAKWYATDIPLHNDKAQRYPPPERWIFVNTSVTLLGLALVIWVGWLYLNETLIADSCFDLRACKTNSEADAWRLLYIALIASGLLAAQAMLLYPFLASTEFRQHSLLNSLSFTAAAAETALLLVAAVALIARGSTAQKGFGIVTFLGPVAFGLVLWSLFGPLWQPNPSNFLAHRAIVLHFGSSPSWPIIGAIAGIVLVIRTHLIRVHLATADEPEPAIEIPTALAERLEDAYRNFRNSTRSLTGLHTVRQQSILGLTVALLVVTFGILRIQRDFSSVDGGVYDLLRLGLQAVLAVGLLACAWQLNYLWHHLQTFIVALSTLPIRHFFTQSFPAAGNRPIWVRRISVQSLSTPIRAAVVLGELASNADAPIEARMKDEFQTRLRALLSMKHDSGAKKTRADYVADRVLLRATSRAIAEKAFPWLHDRWHGMPLTEEYFSAKFLEKIKPGPKRDISGPERETVGLVSALLALHYTPYLVYCVRQIQNLALGASLALLLLIFSVSTYEMQAPQLAGRVLLGLFAVVVTALWTNLAAMERNAILSRLAGTKPGELNKEFYVKLVGYLGLPALGLLASQFPAISNFLISWVEPTLEAVR
jgi:hypothetical protein